MRTHASIPKESFLYTLYTHREEVKQKVDRRSKHIRWSKHIHKRLMERGVDYIAQEDLDIILYVVVAKVKKFRIYEEFREKPLWQQRIRHLLHRERAPDRPFGIKRLRNPGRKESQYEVLVDNSFFNVSSPGHHMLTLIYNDKYEFPVTVRSCRSYP